MDKILQTVLDTPELYELLVPESIGAYGIMLGGSRFLHFDTDASDYDLNILSKYDYLKLLESPSYDFDYFLIDGVMMVLNSTKI